jgi:hypothetical protein
MRKIGHWGDLMERLMLWPTPLGVRSLALQCLADATSAANRIRNGSDQEAVHDFPGGTRRSADRGRGQRAAGVMS